MRLIFYILLLSFVSILLTACIPGTAPIQTDVLVIGGGASGTAAAIQAARTGAIVYVVEESPWLGGMLTSAGVSATDGNHRLPSGIWGEFRQHLYDHYGGPDSVFTGWVSNTQFEPHIGQQFFAEMADAETNLTRLHGYWPVEILKEGNGITGAIFENQQGERLEIEAMITIEATELGDVLGLADIPHWTGQDTEANPHDSNVQDLTYAAILQEFDSGTAHLLSPPPEYDPSEFACFCLELCPDSSGEKLNCETVLNYALLPNRRYMLNWPRRGNDYYVDATKLSREEQEIEYQKAKNRTLGLVYFIQQEVGYKHLGLAIDEFPTEDLLPFIPYHREARRVQGVARMEVEDLQDPYHSSEDPLYKYAISVGDYPLDLHHGKNPNAKPEEFPPIPSFSVPYPCLIPKETEGLIVAEKSISVSHVVNGATRLQPSVLLIGQAAGAAAALSVREGVAPRELDIHLLQQTLLDARCWLMPFLDIAPDDWFFQSVQKAALAGLIRGHGVPYQWANQTWFYPDSAVRRCELPSLEKDAAGAVHLIAADPIDCSTNPTFITRKEAVLSFWKGIGSPEAKDKVLSYTDVADEEVLMALRYLYEQNKGLPFEGRRFFPNEPITRKELAWILDQLFDLSTVNQP